MVKTNTNKSLICKLLLCFAVAAVVLLLATPIIFFNYSPEGFNNLVGVQAIWGLQAIFGFGGKTIMNGDAIYRQMSFDFNWTLYITCLVLILIGFTTYFIGPKARGYYIFAALVFVVCAVVIYSSRLWLVNSSIHIGNGSATGDYHLSHLGVGPWASGLLCVVSALACIYEFKTAKLR